MSKSAMGANVMYCGHNGYFIADIYDLGEVNVVHARREVNPDTIMRYKEFGEPTHHLSDFPKAGFWKPRMGVFVVPKSQVKEL
jgi:hypothetical protein